MYYTVNVSYKGQHLFATAPHSITNGDKAREVFETLANRFSLEEGYQIETSRVDETITGIPELTMKIDRKRGPRNNCGEGS